MNKIAEIMYGKVVNIYETSRTLEEMRALFVPAALLVDVTEVEDIGVGYAVDYGSGLETPNFIPPAKILPKTLEEVKLTKIEELKLERDSREQSPIAYGDKEFDYDLKSVIKLNEALDDLNKLGGSQLWICADSSTTMLTAEDIDNIKHLGKVRSNDLHMKYAQLKIYIESLDNIDDVNNVEFDMEIPENE